MFPMMLTMLALTAPAQAQDWTVVGTATGDTTGGTTAEDDTATDPTANGDGVDPAYLDYLDALAEAERIDAIRGNDTVQLWDGEVIVGLSDDPNDRIGTVFVGGGDWLTEQTKEEKWFFSSQLGWGEPFYLLHNGEAVGGYVNILDNVDPNWENHSCYNQLAKYTEQPNPQLTIQWNYSNNIDFFHFDMEQWDPGLQDWVKRGDLFREYHYVPNTKRRYVDHWAFYETYEVPKDVGDAVRIVPSADQYMNTSAFWGALHAIQQADVQQFGEGRYSLYTQIQSVEEQGIDCLPDWD